MVVKTGVNESNGLGSIVLTEQHYLAGGMVFVVKDAISALVINVVLKTDCLNLIMAVELIEHVSVRYEISGTINVIMV